MLHIFVIFEKSILEIRLSSIDWEKKYLDWDLFINILNMDDVNITL